jgi:UrcA family protein
MSVTRRPFGAFGVAALTALAFATPTFAQSDLIVTFDAPSRTITRTQTLDLSDISLSTAAGRAVAHQRVRAAAKQVCRTDSLLDVRVSAEYQRCYSKARADALDKVASIQTASLN